MELVSVFVMQLFLLPLIATTSPFQLPHNCPAKCGHIDISYPFGVGDGCFRPGFELTCNNSNIPPKLFIGNESTFQVTSLAISGSIFATTGITVMPSKVKNYNVTWSLPNNRLYLFQDFHALTIIGCGIFANLIYENVSVGQCVTICDSMQALKDATGSSCMNSIGCCQIAVPGGLINSYMLQLTRVEEFNHLNQDYDVKVFFASKNTNNAYINNRFTTVDIILLWSIPSPQTCEAAKEQNYACLAKDSYCLNASDIIGTVELEGYNCACYDSIFEGNPYIPGGCQDISTTQPSLKCQRKCGHINIPFPFGLTKGCYRNRNYGLSCYNTTKNKTTLTYEYTDDQRYQVDEILIEEGQIRVDIANKNMGYKEIISPFFKSNESLMLNWAINYMTCDQAKNMSTYACVSKHSSCVTKILSQSQVGYHCRCNQGYEGNPYLVQGCTDMNECLHPEKYCLNGSCHNFDGGYICCRPGTSFSPINKSCTTNHSRNLAGFYISISFGIGLIFLLITISLMFGKNILRERIQTKLRRKYFNQNHGLLLQQLISCNRQTTHKAEIFTWKELEKATTNFDQSRIVGRGGHGTVFKGLLSDQRVVAIKKSKLTLKREIDQFINEVVILSRINHRNIVKLFGCCLETEVPLLVYEFISNGTLHNHLHASDLKSTLPWEDRLRIAYETAGALSYLHSAASISIFHRDVKSANILLDEYLTAKVSDFGASRLIPIDQTQVATVVQGTYGYLDPEYHHTGQLTEKSDVYSFGVILVELLTGELPICSSRVEEERNLSVHFLRAIKDNSIIELVEDRVKKESTIDELGEFIQLAEVCLSLSGEKRPTMREVEYKLQSLRMIKKQKNEINQMQHIKEGASPSRSQGQSSVEGIGIPWDNRMINTSDQTISLLTCPR